MPSFLYVGMILMVVAGGGALYYKSTQATIMELTAYNAQLTANVEQIEQANQKNIDTIARMEANFESQRENFEALQSSFNTIREQKNQLQNRLGRHDIGALAAAKPALVERVINTASVKAFRCFELESGAPLTENERSATNGKAFNSECPWIYDDLIASGVLVESSTATSQDNN
jgi:chromosome condensin MukBEF ATPase and DNA-binding subunit MukB|tara:strand:+ start:3569 stop:4090 length:522 start_codon:yes stop_codon:yes gene_type:complete